MQVQRSRSSSAYSLGDGGKGSSRVTSRKRQSVQLSNCTDTFPTMETPERRQACGEEEWGSPTDSGTAEKRYRRLEMCSVQEER